MVELLRSSCGVVEGLSCGVTALSCGVVELLSSRRVVELFSGVFNALPLNYLTTQLLNPSTPFPPRGSRVLPDEIGPVAVD